MAETKIQTTLVLGATDAASAAIKRVAGETRNLGGAVAATGKTAEASGKAFANIREKSGDVESALKGVGDFAGNAEHAVKGLGDAFGATEAVMRLLPGPMGLTAAAIVGAALGAKLLADHIRQSAEKMRLLGGSDAAKLKQELDLSADGAVALSQAIADLPDRGLKPTVELLRQVKANAEAMGKDGAEAATRFVAALGKGPEGLKDFQKEFGKLDDAIADPAALAKRLGLQAETLGVAKQQTAEEQRRAAVEQALALVSARRLELATLQADIIRQEATAREGATVAVRLEAERAAKESHRKEAALQRQIEAQRDVLAGIQAEVLATKAAADARALVASRADVLEAQVAATADKANKVRLQGEAVVARQLVAVQTLNAFDRLHGAQLAANLQLERDALKVKVLQAEAARLALRQQQQQEARQAAAAASQAKSAAADAVLRLQRARVDADGLQTERERLALLEAEAAKERLAVKQSTGNAKTKATQLAAIDQELANKKRALAVELAATDKQLAEDNQKTIEASNARAAERAQQLADATAANARASAATMAQRLRELGRVDAAVLAERRQAQADYGAEVQRINREIDASQKGLGDGTTERTNLELLRKQRLITASATLAEAERRLANEGKQHLAASIASAAASLEGPARALEALAQVGPAFARSGAWGQGITAGVKGIQELSQAMTAADGKARKLTAAAGDTFSNLAGIIITADTQRTLAQIDNDAKREASTATTEEQRAAIVQAAEDKKAKALERAERIKAGIMAAVELAKAIASAASYDYVAAAGHGAAAVAFGAIAGGALGGSDAGTAGATGGSPGGFGTSSAPGGGGGTQQAQGSPTVININTPLTSKQDVAKGITTGLRSLSTTGYAKSKGA